MTKLPQIPGYRMIEKLGQGGMADVYLGIQEKLQRYVAIKVMIPSLFRDDQFSTRFIKEAQTAAQLNHPNIITIHDVGETGDSYYIVMEYLEESLNDRLKQRGYLSPGEALEVVKMIAAALDYAHKKGFIHRDIKPDNIMFRSDGTVVLVDFGIARAIDSTTHLTRTGMSIGTPHYMSPEQCLGDKIDGRSDIYSLGVQLYEILTSEPPYKAENTAGIIIKHIQDPIPRLPDHLKRYQPLIDKMMAKDRNMRIQSGGEVIKYIDRLLTTKEFVQQPVTIPETATVSLDAPTIQSSVPSSSSFLVKQGEKKKWLVPFVLLTVVVILTVAMFYFTLKKPLKDEDKTVPAGSILQQTGETVTPEKKQSVDQHLTETVSKPETKEDTKTVPDTNETPDNVNKDIGQKETPSQPDEQKTAAEKNSTQKLKSIPMNDANLKQTETQAKTESLKKEEKREKQPTPAKKEARPLKVRTVNLLELAPSIRQDYNNMMQRLQVKVLNARFQAQGQVTLDLLIKENGTVTVSSLTDVLTVVPDGRKQYVVNSIERRMNNISLTPPKDKKGNTVRFNWRITYKVGKYMNRIILTKQ